MARLLAAATLAATAGAFLAPAPVSTPVVARAENSEAFPFLKRPEKLDGTMIGDVGFDPLRLAEVQVDLTYARGAEVKHGRIAMLACLGQFVVGAGWRFPGELANSVKFTSIEGNGYAALSQLSPVDYALIFVSVGFLETRVMKEVVKGEFPGDLRNGLFTEGWDGFSEADKKRKINIELNNGRAAMMGIAGMMVHESLGVSPFFPQAPL